MSDIGQQESADTIRPVKDAEAFEGDETSDYPEISPQELDEVCSLDVDPDEKDYLVDVLTHDEKKGLEMLLVLAGRYLDEELPVAEETFAYKRNLRECKKLRKSVYRLLKEEREKIDIDREKKPRMTEEERKKALEDAATFYALEKKKAWWLDANFYPVVYANAISVAKAEVSQFLIRYANTH